MVAYQVLISHLISKISILFKAGTSIKAVFWLVIMVSKQMSRSRFKQSRISAHPYLCFGLFCKFFGDFCVYFEIIIFKNLLVISIGKFFGDFGAYLEIYCSDRHGSDPSRTELSRLDSMLPNSTRCDLIVQ